MRNCSLSSERPKARARTLCPRCWESGELFRFSAPGVPARSDTRFEAARTGCPRRHAESVRHKRPSGGPFEGPVVAMPPALPEDRYSGESGCWVRRRKVRNFRPQLRHRKVWIEKAWRKTTMNDCVMEGRTSFQPQLGHLGAGRRSASPALRYVVEPSIMHFRNGRSHC
jgi:hypothetical protein